MDSDHEYIHDAVEEIFPNIESFGLIRHGDELYLRIDCKNKWYGTEIEELRRKTHALDGKRIDASVFWEKS